MTQCSSFPCQNGGTCASNNNTAYSCSCQIGYFGNNCQINTCLSNPCQNGGICSSLSNMTYSCACPTGYFGNICQYNPCLSNPCLNGVCTSLNSTTYSCLCSSFAYGNNCQNCNLYLSLVFIYLLLNLYSNKQTLVHYIHVNTVEHANRVTLTILAYVNHLLLEIIAKYSIIHVN